MTTAQGPRSVARETAAMSARKPLWMFASCPLSVASVRRCSHASSSMFPLSNVRGSSMVAAAATRTILYLKVSVSEPVGRPRGAPNRWQEQRWQKSPDWIPGSAAFLDPRLCHRDRTRMTPLNDWSYLACPPPMPPMPLHIVCFLCL